MGRDSCHFYLCMPKASDPLPFTKQMLNKYLLNLVGQVYQNINLVILPKILWHQKGYHPDRQLLA